VRIGLLGGSFDPIHRGHLRLAALARETLGLEHVLLVPAGRPPHRAAPAGDAFDRYAMTALAAADDPSLRPSPLELQRPGPSYTVDTLEALGAGAPGVEFFLLLGADAAALLPSWHRAARVLELARVAVVGRPGRDGAAPPPGTLALPTTGLDVSSSALRAEIRAGRDVRAQVGDGVADYIAKRRLYT
jgi:nicotinate-nucleotide adenylyltransferase